MKRRYQQSERILPSIGTTCTPMSSLFLVHNSNEDSERDSEDDRISYGSSDGGSKKYTVVPSAELHHDIKMILDNEKSFLSGMNCLQAGRQMA